MQKKRRTNKLKKIENETKKYLKTEINENNKK